MMKTTLPFLLAPLLALALSRSAQAVLITFGAAADYNTSFTEVNNGTSSLSYGVANGVGGVSGRVDVLQGTLSDTTALYNVSSYNLSDTTPHTLSIYFLTPTTIGGAAAITAAQVGFSESTAQGFLSAAGQDYISARVRASAAGTTYFMSGTFANNGTAVNVNDTTAFSLSTSTWYKLSATFTDIGTSFSYTATLENWGASGTSFVSTVQSIALNTLAQTSLSNGSDTTAFAGLRANGNAQNKVLALDNFEIITVPEPGSFALLLGGVAMMFTRRRRSRRCNL